jgi:hypothetical protein
VAKKILTILIVALFCLLAGLVVLFFYLNKSTNPKNEVVSFIPPQTEFILRIRQTAVTTNKFLANPLVRDCFKLGELPNQWSLIDSITSRNYKTAEVLAKNTSYLCLDTLQHYLILIDLDKKANEQFIDQFLVGTASTRKMEKFKEGYKAFYPAPDQPLYYFVHQNVFGISADEGFLANALTHGLSQVVEPEFQLWQQNSKSPISVWGRQGTEKTILGDYSGISFFGGWMDLFAQNYSLEIFPENDKIRIMGRLEVDSLNPWILRFSREPVSINLPFYDVDSASSQSTLYNMWVKDSLGKEQNASLQHHCFTDSAGQTVNLLVSGSNQLIRNFKNLPDTNVQVIPMADEKIKEIFLLSREESTRFLPDNPLPADSSQYFVAIYKNRLFVTTSTEFILRYVPDYPDKNFIKIKSEPKDLVFSVSHGALGKSYWCQYRYQWTKERNLVISAEIRTK